MEIKKIYIAGKITGLSPIDVKDKFDKAKRKLEDYGYVPMSPLDNGCTSECWAQQMMACLPMLMESDGIYLLSDWKESDGAKIEETFARKANKIIIKEVIDF